MESKFKASILANLSNATPVITGTKASNDVVPVINIMGIPNKFTINRLAADALKLHVEDRVRIFDMGVACPINERFIIAKVDKEDTSAAKVAPTNSSTKATTGIDLAFNYSGIWSILVQGKDGAVAMGYDAMCAMGVVVAGKTAPSAKYPQGNDRHRATNNIKMNLVELGAGIIQEVEYENIFVLTDYKATPKSAEDLQKELKEKAAKKEAAVATEGTEADVEEDVDFEDEEDDDDEA